MVCIVIGPVSRGQWRGTMADQELNESGRLDYESELVSPDGYMVVCPHCDHRHEAESTRAYRCPECDGAIGVNV